MSQMSTRRLLSPVLNPICFRLRKIIIKKPEMCHNSARFIEWKHSPCRTVRGSLGAWSKLGVGMDNLLSLEAGFPFLGTYPDMVWMYFSSQLLATALFAVWKPWEWLRVRK